MRGKDAPFHEYNLPQLLLEWLVKTDDFIGIRYFSTRNPEATNSLFLQNYVFPAADLQSVGYSQRLCSAFSLTKPVRVNEAVRRGAGLARLTKNNTQFRDFTGTEHSYHDTCYSHIEAFLEDQHLYTLAPLDVSDV
jgi:hypothetical protein